MKGDIGRDVFSAATFAMQGEGQFAPSLNPSKPMGLAHCRPHKSAIGAGVEQERHGERAVALGVEAPGHP